MPCTTDQPAGSFDPTTPKLLYPGSKDVEFCNDDFYYDLNMDDVDLTFENYKDRSGCLNQVVFLMLKLIVLSIRRKIVLLIQNARKHLLLR